MTVRLVRLAPVLIVLAALAAWLLAAAPGRSAPQLPVPKPLVSDYLQLNSSTTPPTEAQCFSAGRRCFAPAALHASYNLNPLYDAGFDGSGRTIAVVDSYGSDTMAHDLHVFDQAFGL